MTTRTHYKQTIGRITLEVNRDGYLGHGYGYGASIGCQVGWNEDAQIQTHAVSVEELRDLRYLIDRALAEDF